MHGSVAAVTGLQKSDLLITLGARFDDRVTGQLSTFAPDAKVIHADIDPAEISKNRIADVPIVGDVPRGHRRPHRGGRPPTVDAGTRRRLRRLARADRRLEGRPSRWATPTPEDGRRVAPQYVIERHRRASPGPRRSTSPASASTRCGPPSSSSTSAPTPGSTPAASARWATAVPAAMGAKVGEPDRTVWAIDGDGCFQMTNQELATCVINNIPIKVAIINNSSLGMVRQWQTLFYNERYSNTDLHTSVGSRIPDFVKLADAYGCVGLRCERPEDVDADDQAGDGDQRPPGRRRLRRAPRRHGLADGAGRASATT